MLRDLLHCFLHTSIMLKLIMVSVVNDVVCLQSELLLLVFVFCPDYLLSTTRKDFKPPAEALTSVT